MSRGRDKPVTRSIELIDVERPPMELGSEPPSITGGRVRGQARRAPRGRVDADWIVVYGDREHAANLIFLCNLDPRFEEALLVIGSGRPTLILGKEDVGYVPIVPIEVDVICCPTFSLMGIDRAGGPTLETALREIGLSDGDRIGVAGWKALAPTSSAAAGRRSSRPHSSSTRCATWRASRAASSTSRRR